MTKITKGRQDLDRTEAFPVYNAKPVVYIECTHANNAAADEKQPPVSTVLCSSSRHIPGVSKSYISQYLLTCSIILH